MERRSGLGFGFFNKGRAKSNNKRSENQIAELQAKVAIRGSIQHVWGETAQRRDTIQRSQTEPILPEQTIPSSEAVVEHVSDDALVVSEAIHPEPVAVLLPSSEGIIAPALEHDITRPVIREHLDDTVSPRTPQGPIEPSQIFITSMTDPIQRRSSATSSLLSDRAFTLDPQGQCVHKKFSFCPSNISLVQARSPSLQNPRSPRSTSIGSYPKRASAFSTSTPSIINRTTSLKSPTKSDIESDRQVSIADDDDDMSMSDSLRHSTSIISHQSHDPYGSQVELPGQIYAPMIHQSLRPDHAPMDYDEDEESLSGLSEVNAGYSDVSDAEYSDDGKNLINEKTINNNLRRTSVLKRVSYTQLDSGDYMIERRARSSRESERNDLLRRLSLQTLDQEDFQHRHGLLNRHQSVRSDESGWSIEREVIHGVI